jgi:hypothetical protein
MVRPSIKKTTRITVETETLMIVRQAKTTHGWCPVCRADVNVITLDDNARTDPGATALVRECLAANKLHSWQPAAGPVQICLTSLLRCFEAAEAQSFFRRITN